MNQIVIKQMPEGTTLTHTMPDWVKLNIADCVVVFGRLEQQVIEIAWLLKKEDDVKTRIKTARAPATNNFEDILELMEGIVGEKFDGLRNGFEDLAKTRNMMVHGSWLMAADQPYVVWHKFLEDPDSVMGEYCDQRRFDAFKRKAEFLLNMCRRYHDMLEVELKKTTSVLKKVG